MQSNKKVTNFPTFYYGDLTQKDCYRSGGAGLLDGPG
jgi:hypothetical protein